jgi:hypothetical protein
MVRYDDTRRQWYSEFEQAGERVFKRFPKGITRPQAETWEVRKRREIFDRVALEKRPDFTLREAFDLWLLDNRRKNQDQAKERGEAMGAVDRHQTAPGSPRNGPRGRQGMAPPQGCIQGPCAQGGDD